MTPPLNKYKKGGIVSDKDKQKLLSKIPNRKFYDRNGFNQVRQLREEYRNNALETGIFEPINQSEKDWWTQNIKDSEINNTDLHKKYSRYLMRKNYKWKSKDLVPDQTEDELKLLNEYMKGYENRI